MVKRCTNPKSIKWPRYGARGIKVCSRWIIFENFYADMGDRPEGLTLDRIDNDGNYEPGNCRWATVKVQTRNTSRNQRLVYEGSSYTLVELSEKVGLDYRVLLMRLRRGMPLDRAVLKADLRKKGMKWTGSSF